MEITSRDNKLIKYVKFLEKKKYRDEEEAYFVEGIKISLEALRYKENIKYVLICTEMMCKDTDVDKIIDILEKENIEYYITTKKVFNSISDTITPQGILVVLNKSMSKVDFKENGIYLILDDVQDPGNVGTIIRTADAINVDGVIVSNKTADIYSPKTLRSTMGSIFRVPVEVTDDLVGTVLKVKEKSVDVVVSCLGATKSLYEEDFDGNGVAIVVGNESQGVSDELINIADKRIKIPMPGSAESLNVSVASGVIMYEVAKQKKRF